jgi:hypothetical protein
MHLEKGNAHVSELRNRDHERERIRKLAVSASVDASAEDATLPRERAMTNDDASVVDKLRRKLWELLEEADPIRGQDERRGGRWIVACRHQADRC